jgi:hypothetical protein
MSQDNSRLTHARYSVEEFKSDNSGDYHLPNGADQKFIQHVESIPSMRAVFYNLRGDIMVSCRDNGMNLGESEELPEVLELIANEYNMQRTNSFTSPNTITFEYHPDESNQR